MRPVRVFCEFPAGLASVSLRLHGGPRCRPPISRMGNKAGYAEVILAALGLRSGQGAGAYVWAEADDDVRALLRCYPDAAMLRRVAEIIRSWADEEPRALWERLRAERKARGTKPLPSGAAEWVLSMGWGNGATPGAGMGWTGGYSGSGNSRGNTRYPDIDSLTDRCHQLAEYACLVTSNRLIPGCSDPQTGEWRNAAQGGTTFGGDFATPAGEVAERFEEMAGEVAGYGILAQWAFRRGEPDSGFNAGLLIDREPNERGGNGAKARTCDQEAGLWRYTALSNGWPPVAVLARIPSVDDLSAMLGTPGDLEGVIVYMDPPYQGTTGYAHDLGRDEVVRIAEEFDRAGAVVCVSEAEVVIPSWEAVEITGGRKGQRRTFSKQQAEWLTMNRTPQHRIASQAALFGGAV